MADDTTNTGQPTALNPTPELLELYEAFQKASAVSDEVLEKVDVARNAYERLSKDWEAARRRANDAYAAWSRAKYADMAQRGKP